MRLQHIATRATHCLRRSFFAFFFTARSCLRRWARVSFWPLLVRGRGASLPLSCSLKKRRKKSVELVPCTVVFQENQQVGGARGPVQAKRNACTLVHKEGTPNQLAWVMEHETWWPGVAYGADSCGTLQGQPGMANASIAACFGCTHCLPADCGPCLASVARL